MLEEIWRYMRAKEFDWELDERIKRAQYLRAAKAKGGKCYGRKKKPNMNHVSRTIRLKHRRAR